MEILARSSLIEKLLSGLLFLGSTILLTLVLFFVTPLLLTGVALEILFAVVLTIGNVVGFLTSWYYFNKTKCYSAEGNLSALISYKLIGGDLTHIILGFGRLVLNLFTIYVIFFVGLGNWIILLTISFSASIFVVESFFNSYAIATKIEDVCNEKSLLFAELKERIIYCHENPNDPQCDAFLDDNDLF